MEKKRLSLSWGFILIILTIVVTSVESVVGSDWSMGQPSESFIMAWINVTYINPTNGKLHTENAEVGKYGVGPVTSASGMVVHVKSVTADGKVSHQACEQLTNHIPDGPWIALIQRGSCNFDTKLQNAQAKKAVAMVVYDRIDRETLEKMGLSNCKNCSIPAIFTFKRTGEEIATLTDAGTRVDMFITVGSECLSPPYGGINRTSILFVSISFIVLMIISLAWLVFYYVQRFRYLHAKDRLAQRLCNAAKKALAKIPTRNIKLTEKELNGDVECCAVCIEFYASGDVLRTLPCRHEFHKSCVDPWLLEHRTCPMCKMDILKYYGFIFTGSQESILHLDMEDGVLNSSESRETDTPTHEVRNHFHPIRYSESHEQVDDNPHGSTTSSYPTQQIDPSIRKPSLISLTVVAAPRGSSVSHHVSSSIGGGKLQGESKSSKIDKYRHRSSYPGDCSSVEEKPPSLPEYQHPMCHSHEDKSSHSLGSVSVTEVNETSAVTSHKPLIHRKGSLNHCQSLGDDKSEKAYEVASSETHKEDLTMPQPEQVTCEEVPLDEETQSLS